MSFYKNELFDNELFDNEKVIYSCSSSIYINTEEYGISDPLPLLNPLYGRILTGRGIKNKLLLIHGKFYVTNYRMIFKARKDSFSIFTLPHDLGNSVKNRLHGKIDIFLSDIILTKRFHHSTMSGLNIYTVSYKEYKFALYYFVNSKEVSYKIEQAKESVNETTINNLKKDYFHKNKLIVNQRLEKHNKFWLGIGKVIGFLNIFTWPLRILNIIIDTPFYILVVIGFLFGIKEND